jgi:hypothetical protein
MQLRKELAAFGALVAAGLISAFTAVPDGQFETGGGVPLCAPRGCVFLTLFGEESSANFSVFKTPEQVRFSVNRGLAWLQSAQQNDGGWGAGSHHRQDIIDPHSVPSDPATTAMVAMSLLRSGTTLQSGPASFQLKKALDYILSSVESTPEERLNITTQTGTQIQTKLGANIDVILASQFLSNILDYPMGDARLKLRVQESLNTCARKIQRAQAGDGSFAGSGWAGVLQSSFATNALESALDKGADVDRKVLEKSRDFQKGNYDPETGNTKTDLGAGIVLYSVSGSSRASAVEAREAQEAIDRAVKDGKLQKNAPVSAEALQQSGMSRAEAMRYATSYQVYQSAKGKAQEDNVMSGFGNNGGEEFLSYLQTGESMVIGNDAEWTTWYDNMSGRLLAIQNQDGSWNGHHCITSPVFCTATCLLILSITNDIDKLSKTGQGGAGQSRR